MDRMIDKEQSVHSVDFVCFDFETTGLSYSTDRILEVGAIRCNTNEVFSKFSTLVNVEQAIPAEATQVNNITNDMIVGAPLIGEVLKDFCEFAENSVLVAHNISFDFRFLNAELARNNLPILANKMLVDTVMLAKRTIPKLASYKLEELVKQIGVTVPQQHRALDDAHACRELLLYSTEQMSFMGELSLSEILV